MAFPPTVYAHLFQESGSWIVQYWIFYPYDDWVLNHEGDWEHINVVLTSDLQSIADLDYYMHWRVYTPSMDNGIVPVLADKVHILDGTHPVIYVGGQGSLSCWGSSGSGLVSGASFPAGGEWLNVGEYSYLCQIPNETVTPDRYIPYSEIDVILMPAIEHIDPNIATSGYGLDYFIEHPETAWMRADCLWGHTRTYIPGSLDVFQWVEPGITAPKGPRYQPAWEHRQPGEISRYRSVTVVEGVPMPYPMESPPHALFVEAVLNGEALDECLIELQLADDGETFLFNGTGRYAWYGESRSVLLTVPQKIEVDGQEYYFKRWSDTGGAGVGRIRQMYLTEHTEHAVAEFMASPFDWQIVGSNVGLPQQAQSAVWGDYDRDGDDDVFFIVNESTPLLMRNENGVFEEVAFPSISGAQGAWWGDHDGDHDLDLMVSTSYSELCLYVNGGNGFFLGYCMPRTAGTIGYWVDADNDSDLDFLWAGDDPILYSNQGDASFDEVEGFGNTVEFDGLVWTDFDGDGDLDAYRISPWSYTSVPDDGFMLENYGGVFAFTSSSAVPPTLHGTESAVFLDVDRDGDEDFVANAMLFRNTESGWSESVPIPAEPTPFLSGGDLNNDGWVDLISGGRLLLNDGGVFVDLTCDSLGEIAPSDWHFVDYDNDNDLDLWTIVGGDFILYTNAGNYGDDSSIRVSLRGHLSNSQGVGARVCVEGGVNQVRTPSSGYGGLGASDLIGIGSQTSTVDVTVYWPSGYLQLFPDINPGTKLVVEEGSVFDCGSKYVTDLSTGLVTWNFSWRTDFLCNPENDRVLLLVDEINPAPCEYFAEILSPDNCEYVHYEDTDGNWYHRLSRSGLNCQLDCEVPFVPRFSQSGLNTDLRHGVRGVLWIDACISVRPPRIVSEP